MSQVRNIMEQALACFDEQWNNIVCGQKNQSTHAPNAAWNPVRGLMSVTNENRDGAEVTAEDDPVHGDVGVDGPTPPPWHND